MFDNTVKTEWLEDEPRKMRLLETIRYTDSSGQVWEAPKGSIIDGASIPWFFRRIIGTPFVGLYRRPSVIHDVYCDTKTEPSKAVHAMFDEAMECEGVNKVKRKAMATAVKRFGPTWKL